jgi:hypothetical protein
MDRRLGRLTTRLARVLDATVDDHIAQPTEPLQQEINALGEIQALANGMAIRVDEYLAAAPADTTPPELREALLRFRTSSEALSTVSDFSFYAIEITRNIPIRFVQFFDGPGQILTDAQLRRVVTRTNRVFRFAGLRFHLWRNYAYFSPEFARLRDANDNHFLYEWPANVADSPLLKRLYYPDQAYCELGFERPLNNIETRYHAQMRAGTYCAPIGEILVYVNQGYSNGGQYPWYSRIIGMTRHHVLRYTFQHEVGHYLGLPHTFPCHQIYGYDYNFGRMVGAVAGKDLGTTLRRYYETTDHLLNPETGQRADFSMFWDFVFKPGADVEHRFFSSREAASAWEPDLQPIEQLEAGVICRRNDPLCEEQFDEVRLQMTVAAGCKGEGRDFTDCEYPPTTFFTGDPQLWSFSRFGSTPDTIQLNVMAYYYPWSDGSDLDYNVVEDVFLTPSQIEQIDRVLTYDVPTPYPGIDGPVKGLRPELNICNLCHSGLPSGD